MAGHVPFQSTLWTVIRSAGKGDRSSFDDFVRRYRRPLASWLQARGIGESDAEDLVQDVFLRIYEKGLLAKLGEERGRFRSYLLAVARNLLGEARRLDGAEKRGGGQTRIPLDAVPEGKGPAAAGDDEFDRLWVQNLVQVAFERMQAESAGGDATAVDLLKAYTRGEESYAQLGARVKLSESQVTTALFEARKRLRKVILDLLADYVLSPEELEEERAFVLRFLQ